MKFVNDNENKNIYFGNEINLIINKFFIELKC